MGDVDHCVGRWAEASAAYPGIDGDVVGHTLHIEILYNEYNFVGAFAVASLLTLLAVLTLSVKTLVERTGYRRR
jgi:sulfate/thiosulfate transport system permease protein